MIDPKVAEKRKARFESFKEKNPAMAEAAELAIAQLDDLPQDAVKLLGNWIKTNYMKAGLKPLARGLMYKAEEFE